MSMSVTLQWVHLRKWPPHCRTGTFISKACSPDRTTAECLSDDENEKQQLMEGLWVLVERSRRRSLARCRKRIPAHWLPASDHDVRAFCQCVRQESWDMARNASHFAANWPTSRSNEFRQKNQKKKWRRPTHGFLHLNLKSLVRQAHERSSKLISFRLGFS